jgi:hypothetical protein
MEVAAWSECCITRAVVAVQYAFKQACTVRQVRTPHGWKNKKKNENAKKLYGNL